MTGKVKLTKGMDRRTVNGCSKAKRILEVCVALLPRARACLL